MTLIHRLRFPQSRTFFNSIVRQNQFSKKHPDIHLHHPTSAKQQRRRRQLHTQSASKTNPNTSKMARTDAESSIKRNPHPDFSSVQASRPPFPTQPFTVTQTPSPSWNFGTGANTAPKSNGNDDASEYSKHPPIHVSIDPYAPGRPAVYNYKLLISAIVPRPIGFLSTVSLDGKSSNLAPFSYTQMINHDPPLFIVGFAGGFDNAKDSLRNLQDTKECVINMISEDFIEAANSTSVDAPFGVSEWALAGLHGEKCEVVKCERVGEAVFSVEGRLESLREWESKGTPGKKTGVLAIIEGVRFWAREDALNEEQNLVDPAILKAVGRMGGITYCRTAQAFELLRPSWKENVQGDEEAKKLVVPKLEGQ